MAPASAERRVAATLWCRTTDKRWANWGWGGGGANSLYNIWAFILRNAPQLDVICGVLLNGAPAEFAAQPIRKVPASVRAARHAGYAGHSQGTCVPCLWRIATVYVYTYIHVRLVRLIGFLFYSLVVRRRLIYVLVRYPAVRVCMCLGGGITVECVKSILITTHSNTKLMSTRAPDINRIILIYLNYTKSFLLFRKMKPHFFQSCLNPSLYVQIIYIASTLTNRTISPPIPIL